METYYRPTRAEISVDALRHNIKAFREAHPHEVKLSLCVKANAYGHGAIEVARVAEQAGADYLNTAFFDEAIQLRHSGVVMPILILGYTPPEGIPTAFCHNITLNVFSQEVLEELENVSPALSASFGGRRLKVHVKIDSGMGRLGLRTPEDAVAFMTRLSAIDGVEVEGVFTHFACADETDKSYTTMQHQRFQAVLEALAQAGLLPPVIHASNSAGAIDTPQYAHNMVRIGVSLYGLYPSAEVNHQIIDLQPVLALKTRVIHVKKVEAGEAISYGARYHAQAGEWIATIPVGYADGYSRLLTGKAEVLIRGKRVPVVGTICMDQCMLSLSALGEDAAKIQTGEEVVLIGAQGSQHILIDEVADKLNTIHYEVACMLAHRIPRVYVSANAPDLVVNPLWHSSSDASDCSSC